MSTFAYDSVIWHNDVVNPNIVLLRTKFISVVLWLDATAVYKIVSAHFSVQKYTVKFMGIGPNMATDLLFQL